MRFASDVNGMTLAEFYSMIEATGFVRRLLELAHDEDLGQKLGTPWPGETADARKGGLDITSAACIAPHQRGRSQLIARKGGVIAGLRAVPTILQTFGATLDATLLIQDGSRVEPGTVLGELSGPLDEMLEVERTLLNLVARLSGVATRTAQFVALIPAGTKAKVYDTRKTTPGLRVLEKYAVRCGGGRSHRLGLFDAMLIKDNHLAGVSNDRLPGYVRDAVERGRRESASPLAFVQVEVTTLDQLRALLTLPSEGKGVFDIVLLDNMTVDTMTQAASIRNEHAPWLELEASGGVNLETIAGIAATGVDRISVGGLTHSAVSLDLALDVVV
jgi:nicotinate-nucleotide pyrophosphorylase (carboxylating)